MTERLHAGEQDWRSEFSRFRGATQEREPGLLHFAAHSHHFWPDVTLEAQQQAWLDAASLVDEKWDERIFSELVPAVRGHIARHLGLRDPGAIALAPNTHELLIRLFSCFDESGDGGPRTTPVRILSTDGEFHSFRRQASRWEEAGRAVVQRVPARPFESFAERLLERARRAGDGPGTDLVYLSHVLFDSGLVVEVLEELARTLPEQTFLVVDAYHGFMALPTSWRALEDRAFYLSGGYKYAMAGEGVCFMHCPEGWGRRPVNTGWYGVFGDLQRPPSPGAVPYAVDGNRFFGATFDPTALYRFDAVMRRWRELGVDIELIHAHVLALQERFLAGLAERPAALAPDELLLPRGLLRGAGGGEPARAHFLAFERADAADLHRALRRAGILTDVRGDRLRLGFGAYQTGEDVDELVDRLVTRVGS